MSKKLRVRGSPSVKKTGQQREENTVTAMANAGSKAVFLGTAPASRKDYKLGLTVTVILIVAFAVTAPWANVQLNAYPAFVPIYNAAVIVLDLITAVLLLAQFRHLRERSFLLLAGGYLFTPPVMAAHAVSFPDAFIAGNLIGGSQTTAWLWMGWHGVFPLFIGGYAVLRKRETATGITIRPVSSAEARIFFAGTMLLAGVIIFFATVKQSLLPELMAGNQYKSAFTRLILAVGWTTHLAALFLLIRFTRLKRLIDTWLAVTVVALLIDLALSAVLINGRYQVGFYLGRVYGLLGTIFVLIVLLREAILLYGNAVHSAEIMENIVQQRTADLKGKKVELQEKNKQLQLTISQLESFNYIASHDLQEPLRKIQTFVELLQENKYDEKARNDYSNKIKQSSVRMSQLIQSLLAYSRLSQETEAFQPTNLNKVLDDVKTDYEMIIAEKEATINSVALPTIPAIPFQMHQLFSNIIGNSLKFSDKKPEINITSRIVSRDEMDIKNGITADKFVEIRLSDNGIGFNNQYNEKIFHLFQRLHPASKYSGTGIGLSIVDKVIQHHNGFIKADGEINNGATFTIYLPIESSSKAGIGS